MNRIEFLRRLVVGAIAAPVVVEAMSGPNMVRMPKSIGKTIIVTKGRYMAPPRFTYYSDAEPYISGRMGK